uniref:Uncharacterized protein n=1 Tax=Capra hircus TaxID=9925 RepID=A0A452FW81_CAPHI
MPPGRSQQPRLSLENSAACGTSVLQDSKVVRVLDQFQVVPLQFSKDLDAHNPNTPEWREDVGLVVSRLLSKETSIPEELMVTVVKPGLPTLADLHVLLPTRKRSLTSDKVPPAATGVGGSGPFYRRGKRGSVRPLPGSTVQ